MKGGLSSQRGAFLLNVANLPVSLNLMMSPGTIEVDDAVTFYRSCVETAVLSNPIWTKMIKLRRQKFVQKLDRDAASCFRCARLLDEPIEAVALRCCNAADQAAFFHHGNMFIVVRQLCWIL